LAIADDYDAMTNDRPHRKAVSHGEAIEELKRCAGSQFDPELVERFLSLIPKLIKSKHKKTKYLNIKIKYLYNALNYPVSLNKP
jgi:HD-GYP domain-containing protein (c-di-GMP phosphodiesterase class II)